MIYTFFILFFNTFVKYTTIPLFISALKICCKSMYRKLNDVCTKLESSRVVGEVIKG